MKTNANKTMFLNVVRNCVGSIPETVKEDDELTPEAVAKLVADGEVTMADLTEVFQRTVKEAYPALKGFTQEDLLQRIDKMTDDMLCPEESQHPTE